VIDHGRGIEPQTFARVFEPFFSSRPGGTGLGLPTLLGIVEQSGGHVFIETEVGAGTTVTVFFPALA
jgi:signal transduction histidine kinase